MNKEKTLWSNWIDDQVLGKSNLLQKFIVLSHLLQFLVGYEHVKKEKGAQKWPDRLLNSNDEQITCSHFGSSTTSPTKRKLVGNIHWHLGFNNLLRPNHQDNYSSFGSFSEKVENYKLLKNDM